MAIRDKLQVMVVDDMATSRGLITQALDEIGIVNYETESSAGNAWSRLQQKPVHLVLSDMVMPGMDGLQLLQAMRSSRSMAKTAFILVTGRADDETIRSGIKLGMNNFIRKPFEARDMKRCIEKVFGPI